MIFDDGKLEGEFDKFLDFSTKQWKFRIDFMIENPLYKARAIKFLSDEIESNFELKSYDFLFNHKYDYSQFFTDREDIALFLKLRGFKIISPPSHHKCQE